MGSLLKLLLLQGKLGYAVVSAVFFRVKRTPLAVQLLVVVANAAISLSVLTLSLHLLMWLLI